MKEMGEPQHDAMSEKEISTSRSEEDVNALDKTEGR